jgi:hypothetical protein
MPAVSDTARWWYERGGEQVGPVTFAALQELARGGTLQAATLVWTEGMATWSRAETVPGLAAAVAPGPPPLPSAPAPPPLPGAPPPAADRAAPPFRIPSPAAGGAWGPPAATTAGGAVAEPEHIGIGTVILLSIVTLGIFGLVKFFQTACAYERLAGRGTKFALYFWIFVGLDAAVVLSAFAAFPLLLASFVFRFLALNEALRARREGIARWSLTVNVAADDTHRLYLGLGLGLSFLAVGFVFLVLQAMKWFEDWNAIRATALARG